MNAVDIEEFWKALGRLCDATVNLKDATEQLRLTAESHDKRLVYSEVVHAAILNDIRALRKDLSEAQQKIADLEKNAKS